MKRTAIAILCLVSAQCAHKAPERPIYGSEADYLLDNGRAYKLQKPYHYTLQKWRPSQQTSSKEHE